MRYSDFPPIVMISIHAPREGGDMLWLKNLPPFRKFQSTPPARGATAAEPRWYSYPVISIHAPREGGDAPSRNQRRRPLTFQSTPPARGATRSAGAARSERSISIHAPREGGDLG